MKSSKHKLKCKINGVRKKKCKKTFLVHPIVRRYFYICSHDISLVNTSYSINATQFINDQGNTVQAFRIFGSTGYTNLYINGVMQGGGFYSISTSSLRLNSTGQTIQEATPIIIESIGFRLAKKINRFIGQ